MTSSLQEPVTEIDCALAWHAHCLGSNDSKRLHFLFVSNKE